MNMLRDKRTLRTLKRMNQGHGLYSALITLPDGGSYKLLIKFNKGESITLKVYKDSNTLGKRKANIMNKMLNKVFN